MSLKLLRAAALCMGVLVCGKATAQQVDIEVDSNKPWTHKTSKFTFPAQISNFSRTSIQDLSNGSQIDVTSSYKDDATSTIASLYIYRPAVPDAGFWFDISSFFITRNDKFGDVTPTGNRSTFTLPKNEIPAGLRQSFKIQNLGKSTALSIAPLGRWMVKVRMTSKSLSPEQLENAVENFVNGLGWPSKMPMAGAAIAISDCQNPLNPKEKAKKIDKEGTAILLGAAAASVSEEEDRKLRKTGKVPEHPLLCRERGKEYPLFQMDESIDGYIVGLNDSGTVLAVQRDKLGTLVTKASKPQYSVTVMAPDKWIQFPAYDQLPSPDQALEIIQNERPLSVTSIEGEKTRIMVEPDALKR